MLSARFASVVLVLALSGSSRADDSRAMKRYLLSLEVYLHNDFFPGSSAKTSLAKVKRDIDGCTVEEDDLNGWIQATCPPRGATTTMAMWTCATGGRVFGYMREDPEGGEWDSSIALTFFAGSNGRWAWRKNLLPGVELRDFWGESGSFPDDRFAPVAVRYVLPRTGTTIQVILDDRHLDRDTVYGLTRLTSPAELDAYIAAVRSAKYKTLSLAWNKYECSFFKVNREGVRSRE